MLILRMLSLYIHRCQNLTSYRTAARQGHSMDWTQYHPIEDLHSYLAHLHDTYDFVCMESIGRSHEGSEMVVAKVCRGGCGDKPAMWIGEL